MNRPSNSLLERRRKQHTSSVERVSLRFRCTGEHCVRARCDSRQLMRGELLCLCIRVCIQRSIDSIERRSTDGRTCTHYRGKERGREEERKRGAILYCSIPAPSTPPVCRSYYYLRRNTNHHDCATSFISRLAARAVAKSSRSFLRSHVPPVV